MANIKSQIKRNRQNEKRRLRNRVSRGEARTTVKKARTAIEGDNPKTSKAALMKAISTLDKAAGKGVLHKNNAARRKSRLMKRFAAMGSKTAKAEASKVETGIEAESKKETKRKRTTKKEA